MRHPVNRESTLPAAGLGRLAVAAALLAGCALPQQPAGQPLPEQELRNVISAGGKLINEGGPVFALPGTVRMPSYYMSDPAALTVRAERLDGGSFPNVAAAPVAADGSFTLRGPITSTLFFATTEFTVKDKLHRVRALARAQAGDPIILDPASSLMSAKIALAAQKRSLDDLSYADTTELTSQVRSALGSTLDAVSLDQPNEKLSQQLSAAAKSDTLAASLRKWELALLPASPAPGPSPSPTPTPSPSPEASLEPVK